jgi:hypothetical protein
MAKSVLDAGWGMLKTYLQYKGQQAGRCVEIVSERNTTRTCNSCKARTGPSGLDMLIVRTWVCRECGVTHDRDVNAARNILSAGRLPPPVSGNESSLSVAEPSQTYSRCEAGISAMKAAACTGPMKVMAASRFVRYPAASTNAVLSEATIGGLLGAAAAIPLSVPISRTIGRIVGRVSGQPLVLELAAIPVVAWLLVCVAASALGGASIRRSARHAGASAQLSRGPL